MQARIVAWDAFLSRARLSGFRLTARWAASPFASPVTAAASSRPPSFDEADPRRAKQTYFKPGKTAPDGKPTAGKSAGGSSGNAQRLAKVGRAYANCS